jgi:hypothetical protein
MEKHFLLGEVAKVLDRKPHQIVHLLTTRAIPEPELRIANKRLFSSEDVARLARHFKVTPKCAVVADAVTDSERSTVEGLVLKPPFEVIAAGTTCHEVRNRDGEVFAWTSTRGRALTIAGLLESAISG